MYNIYDKHVHENVNIYVTNTKYIIFIRGRNHFPLLEKKKHFKVKFHIHTFFLLLSSLKKKPLGDIVVISHFTQLVVYCVP